MLVFINFDPFFGKMLIETSTEHFFELPVVDIWVGQQISIQSRRDVKPRQFLAKTIYCRIINCSGVNQFFWFSSFAWSSQIYDTRKLIRNSTYDYRRGYINFLLMRNLTKHLIYQAAGMRTITSGQRDFGEETVSTHNIEEFAEFFALVDLIWPDLNFVV